jgi:hypothetical protein
VIQGGSMYKGSRNQLNNARLIVMLSCMGSVCLWELDKRVGAMRLNLYLLAQGQVMDTGSASDSSYLSLIVLHVEAWSLTCFSSRMQGWWSAEGPRMCGIVAERPKNRHDGTMCAIFNSYGGLQCGWLICVPVRDGS